MTPRRSISLLLCCVIVATAAAPPRQLRADEASAALAKYDKRVDQAIDRALAYLAKQQHAEGHWPSQMGKSTAVASLAVMAFLAKGHTPGAGPYGEAINKGVNFVLSRAKPNGLLVGDRSHGPMYSHCISTLMISEVSGMVDAKLQKRIDEVLPKAVRLILTAQQAKKHNQAHKGGWRYNARSTDSDISCTGWALMSLRSARNNGAPIPTKSIKDAVEFVLRCRGKVPAKTKTDKATGRPKGGVGFRYKPGQQGHSLARTGTAVLCLELCGRHRSKEAIQGGDYILAHPQRTYGASYFYYGLYYCSQAMFQLGGKHWERFAPHMYEMMLKFQRKDGSWPQASGGESKAGPCYSTAMGVLSMAVSYRQLPIYQR